MLPVRMPEISVSLLVITRSSVCPAVWVFFCDVLNVSKRLQQLMKTNSVRVVSLVDVNVEVTTDDDRTTVRC